MPFAGVIDSSQAWLTSAFLLILARLGWDVITYYAEA